MTLLTRAITVEARTCAVVYRHGVRTGVLAAGRHRRPAGSTVVPVDLRERLLAVAPQDVPTADGASVRVTAAVRWSVTDPVAFVEVADDPEAVVYLATQVALREALAAVETDRLARRGSLPLDEVVAAVRTAAVAVGVSVQDVVLKDVLLPPEIRGAATALIVARQRGAALLEEARAETAALRSLANGARLLDAHPALAQLRLVQAVPPGTRLVLAVGTEAARLVEPGTASDDD
jgi:regulator of protease activity HflC (stomatin/prohibitin superfamily)